MTSISRRHEKTLNLSMLRYSFDIRQKEETKNLFQGLKIENEKDIMKLDIVFKIKEIKITEGK